MDPTSEYKKVKDFTDLLNTNLMYFRGELCETYYYGAPWGKGEDQNNHAEVSSENLLKLTEKHRIFTTNGQSSYTDKTTDQRSYLSFYMEKETFTRVHKKLLEDPRIWTTFILKSDNKFLNLLCSSFKYDEISSLSPDKKRIVLTLDCKEPYSVWTRDTEAREEFESSAFENINTILKETVYCFIVCKLWNTEPNADTILLNHLEE